MHTRRKHGMQARRRTVFANWLRKHALDEWIVAIHEFHELTFNNKFRFHTRTWHRAVGNYANYMLSLVYTHLKLSAGFNYDKCYGSERASTWRRLVSERPPRTQLMWPMREKAAARTFSAHFSTGPTPGKSLAQQFLSFCVYLLAHLPRTTFFLRPPAYQSPSFFQALVLFLSFNFGILVRHWQNPLNCPCCP